MPLQRRSLLLALSAGAALPLLQACGGGSDDKDTGTVVALAASDSRFSILVEAVKAAGLVDTLNGAGPFTVFAPTNDAFVALLGELKVSKEALLANKALLTSVLTYHVVPGALRAADVSALCAETRRGGLGETRPDPESRHRVRGLRLHPQRKRPDHPL